MSQPIHAPSGSDEVSPLRSGRHASRSKSGCSTCKTRKVKCDESRPCCQRCQKAQITCEWNQPVLRRPPRNGKHLPDSIHKPTPEHEHLVNPHVNHALPQQNSAAITPTTSTTWQKVPTTISESTELSLTSPNQPISPGHALSNALLLNQDDLQSFEFMPRSLMVLRFGKPWRWSMLSYVHSKVASRETGVLRAFVAVASMERRCLELAEAPDSTPSPFSLRKAQKFKENASHALHLAMQDLSGILNRLAAQPNSHDDLEAVFALWFLILHFGIYDIDLVHTSYMHLAGIRAFLVDWFQRPTEPQVHALPPAAKQLLLFICYLDVMLALGGQGDGKLSMCLMDEPSSSPISFDRLFEEVRVCVPQLWGPDYPAEELLDDIENYRPLRFLYSCQTLKLRVWETGRAIIQGEERVDHSEELWEAITKLGQTYYDLLLLAKSVRRTNGRRVIWTVYHAYLDYCGLKILFCCIPGVDSRPPWLSDLLSDLLTVAHKALNEDQQHVYRSAWPLRMALFRLSDPIHCDWVRTQTAKAGLLLSNMGIPATLPETETIDETLFASHHLSANTSPAYNF